ncbi:MAG: ATP-dependent DNA helicase PcrA [Ruminococcaceae bacterium]|nr:ATP-dependent DNA helicase PcrA [Oscillospiraceae bacterium]
MTQRIAEYKKYREEIFNKAYSFLNDKQREAVFTTENPLLILAGAGSGKTTVLVQRIAFIIKYGNAYFSEYIPDDVLTDENLAVLRYIAESPLATKEDLEEAMNCFAVDPATPWQILSITFTNKAANEMKERLQKILGDAAQDIWAGTFHSICVRILRRYIDRLGYDKSFTIYDTDDQKRLITACIKEKNLDEKTFQPRSILGEISRSKDKLEGYSAYATNAGADFRKGIIAQLFEMYEQRKAAANALDFDDIIFFTVKLLAENEDIRSEYQRRFRYILVDEYQDTNISQFNLVKLLCGSHNNLMVVGDDDQSIYKFRGATIENILNFDRSFDDVKVIKLEQNYRSTSNIIAAANAIIKNNEGRKGKELWTGNDDGEKIILKECGDNNFEGSYITDKISKMALEKGYKYSDFAVLYRVNALSNNLEKAFAKSGIPYRILGGTRFYDRKEIKDIMSYLCVINNPSDNLRLKRIINVPKRGIGDATVDEIERLAIENGRTMLDIMATAQSYPSLSRSAIKLVSFCDLISDFRKTVDNETLPVLFEKVIEKSGYMQMLIDGGQEEADRIDNLKELVSNAVQYEASNEQALLSGFLEEVALISDVDNYDPDSPAVVLMTIHSAKGLEFPVVFLPGMEETIFPGAQSTFEQAELEEERRLAYVAVTRAKKELIITYCQNRLYFGRTVCNQRSRFIDEIPGELCDVQNFYEATPQGFYSHSFAQNSGFRAGSGAQQNVRSVFGQKPRTVGVMQSTQKTAPSLEQFKSGDRVTHAKFGAGLVISAKPMGADVMYEIAFDEFGTKKLMGTYAKLSKE